VSTVFAWLSGDHGITDRHRDAMATYLKVTRAFIDWLIDGPPQTFGYNGAGPVVGVMEVPLSNLPMLPSVLSS
jgi:hypothetical protein